MLSANIDKIFYFKTINDNKIFYKIHILQFGQLLLFLNQLFIELIENICLHFFI